MSQQDLPPGSARLQLADGIAVLRPETAVFGAMVTGWSHQQMARNLSAGTISAQVATIRRFQDFCEVQGPWAWTPAMADDWITELRGIHGLAHSTILSYQSSDNRATRSHQRYQLERLPRTPPGTRHHRTRHLTRKQVRGLIRSLPLLCRGFSIATYPRRQSTAGPYLQRTRKEPAPEMAQMANWR
jgi:hypothetical protein